MSDILERLQPIFHDVLDDSSLRITRDANASNLSGWDSLAHMQLISATEQEFGVRFALGELEELKNVGDMVDLIVAKTGRL